LLESWESAAIARREACFSVDSSGNIHGNRNFCLVVESADTGHFEATDGIEG
jgi:hypothetical protein